MKSGSCVVFDLDDTLYLERDYVHSGFEAAGRWTAQWIGVADFAGRCWSGFIAGRRQTIFDSALRECGQQPTPEMVSALVEIYRTHTPSIALAPDASETLNAISHAGSIAVVSDGALASQSRKVEALGIGSIAAPIVLTGIFGGEFRKPHPRAFQEVERRRPAGAYVHVADNPLKDFAAPKRLGWVTVRVRRRGGLHCAVENSGIAADYEMDDCLGLPEVLARLGESI